jgi:hypothetical protein
VLLRAPGPPLDPSEPAGQGAPARLPRGSLRRARDGGASLRSALEGGARLADRPPGLSPDEPGPLSRPALAPRQRAAYLRALARARLHPIGRRCGPKPHTNEPGIGTLPRGHPEPAGQSGAPKRSLSVVSSRSSTRSVPFAVRALRHATGRLGDSRSMTRGSNRPLRASCRTAPTRCRRPGAASSSPLRRRLCRGRTAQACGLGYR